MRSQVPITRRPRQRDFLKVCIPTLMFARAALCTYPCNAPAPHCHTRACARLAALREAFPLSLSLHLSRTRARPRNLPLSASRSTSSLRCSAAAAAIASHYSCSSAEEGEKESAAYMNAACVVTISTRSRLARVRLFLRWSLGEFQNTIHFFFLFVKWKNLVLQCYLLNANVTLDFSKLVYIVTNGYISLKEQYCQQGISRFKYKKD